MKGLQRIHTEEQLVLFVQLWERVQQVQLEDRPDTIRWNLTADGKYSAKSAYFAQFYGRQAEPHLEKVWGIRAEGKTNILCGCSYRIVTGQQTDYMQEGGHMMTNAACVV